MRIGLQGGEELVLRRPHWVTSPVPALEGDAADGARVVADLARIERLEVTGTGDAAALLRGVWGTALLLTTLVVAAVLLLSDDGKLTFR